MSIRTSKRICESNRSVRPIRRTRHSRPNFQKFRVHDPSPPHAAAQDKRKGGFKPELDEEFEDAHGNVYNRKTYEDLKRQGLI